MKFANLQSKVVNPAVCLILFVSGAAGLIYEIVWTRYLALFLGHTSYAVMMVLAAFMGGLAAGSYWIGKRADQTTRPLKMYGILELGIGIYGLIFPLCYYLSRNGFVGIVASLQPGVGLRVALQLAFSVITILIPTFLMGGTLPVLAKFFTRSMADLRSNVATLYAINSAGAVFGCVLADFWLIPDDGISVAIRWAVGMNFFAGLMAISLDRWGRPAVAEPAAKAASAERFTAAELKLALVGITASGFVAMLYEVAWTRLLGLAIGSSTHAFAIMLTIFIAGIATGAWILAKWKSLQRTLEAFAWLEIAVGVTVFASMFVYSYLPYWFVEIANMIVRREDAYPLYQFIQAFICFVVAFIPTVCLGMTLPLASRILTNNLSSAGGAIGRVYAVNTLGTVLGAVVTGLLLLPWLGLAKTFALGAGINALIGIAILGRKGSKYRFVMAGAVVVVILGVVGSYVAWFDQWPQRLVMGLWRHETPPASRKEFEESADATELRFYADGAGSTVSVNSYIDGLGRPSRSLRVNGKPDAGTSADMPTQLLLGHLPMLLHPSSQKALVVGFGSGMTCQAIATHSSIQSVDVVEISPEVIAASREFAAENGDVLNDPRVHLTLEDAKTFLQITPNRYDVIVSEPSNPWVAGVAGVFSQEFYQSCRVRLSRSGLMTQWVQLYETSDEAIEIVMRTFTSVFPYACAWHVRDDMVLIGSTQPITVDLAALEARFNEPRVHNDLARVEIPSLLLLLSTEMISPANAPFVASTTGPRHSDEFPVLEYVAQRAFFARAKPVRLNFFDELEFARPTTLLGRYMNKHEPTIEDLRAFVRCNYVYHYPSARVVRSLIYGWQQAHPNDSEPVEMLSQLPAAEGSADGDVQRMAPMRDGLWARAVADPAPLIAYKNSLFQSYIARSSAFYVPPAAELQSVIGRLLRTDSVHQRLYLLDLAKLAWDSGRDTDCIRLGLHALDGTTGGNLDFDLSSKAIPDFISRLVETLTRAGERDLAQSVCTSFIDADYVNPRIGMVQRKLTATAPRVPQGQVP